MISNQTTWSNTVGNANNGMFSSTSTQTELNDGGAQSAIFSIAYPNAPNDFIVGSPVGTVTGAIGPNNTFDPIAFGPYSSDDAFIPPGELPVRYTYSITTSIGQSRVIPEPSAIVVWSLVGLVGCDFGRRWRRKSRHV
jgi:hypothetical protein